MHRNRPYRHGHHYEHIIHSNHAFKSNTIQKSTTQRPIDELLELIYVRAHQRGSLLIERIIAIGFVKEIDETVDDGIDIQYRLPVFAQNIQAHLAFEVYIGMVNLCVAIDFGWGMGIMRRDGECEVVRGAFPVSRVGRDGDVEGRQVVGIWECDRGDLPSVEFGDVFLNADFTRSPFLAGAFTLLRLLFTADSKQRNLSLGLLSTITIFFGQLGSCFRFLLFRFSLFLQCQHLVVFFSCV
mmetsp:Transcript_13594/g.38943  ORF Transcript_13594/g.38943 Transcript_13594/m.38943 type:complete len:240 (-) Transcript_13594:150-869(-)